MWEDFQKVLEKRVSRKKVIKNDKYLIITAAKKVLKNKFGEISDKFIEVKDYKTGQLLIELKNSTWKSEFKLNEDEIKKEINCVLKENLIKNIKII